MSPFTLLSGLDLSLKNPKVRVQVISKWTTIPGSRIQKSETVFCDEKGVTIHGIIHHGFAESYETIMDEGEWFAISNFKLQHNAARIRTTKNRFNLILNEKSVLCKTDPSTYCNYYAFKTFRSVLRGLAHPMYCIDIYGALIGVGELEFRELHGGADWDNAENERIVFSLINPEFYQLKCIAYGSNARELHQYWTTTNANVVLCVLTIWEIRWGEGGFKFMTKLEGCSKILFNPMIPEIEAFRNRIPGLV